MSAILFKLVDIRLYCFFDHCPFVSRFEWKLLVAFPFGVTAAPAVQKQPVFAVVFKENDGAPPAKGIVLLDGAVA